jgi:ADP-ribosylglycohydrolase
MLIDKFSGMFYGILIGENLGHINKLSNQSCIGNRYIDYITHTNNMSINLKCMFELCEYVTQNNSYDRFKILQHYFELLLKELYLQGNFKILFDNFKYYFTYENFMIHYNNILVKLYNKELLNKTNEGLIRCIPMILFTTDEIIQDCYITNPIQECIDCNIFFLQILKRCLNNEPIELKDEWTKNTNIKKLIKLVNTDLGMDLSYNQNNCYNTLYCALYAYIHFNIFEQAMEWIILNSRDDVNENACMVGCIMGAKIGNKMMNEHITYFNMMKILNNRETNKYINNLENYVDKFTEIYKSKNLNKI